MKDDTISPLRRRMIEDITARGFTAFLGCSPDYATVEDLLSFQLHLRSEGASAATMNAAVSALRFVFGVTLGRGPINPLTIRQLNRAFHGAKEASGIDKPVSLHTLRHCFATHLLEQKVDIRVIRVKYVRWGERTCRPSRAIRISDRALGAVALRERRATATA